MPAIKLCLVSIRVPVHLVLTLTKLHNLVQRHALQNNSLIKSTNYVLTVLQLVPAVIALQYVLPVWPMQPIQLLLLNAMHIVNLLYNTVMLENATRLVLQVVISITQMLIARLATRYVKHALELPLTAPPVIPPISSIKPASHNALLITSQRIKPVWSVTTQYQLALNLSPSIQQPELKTIKV